MEDRDWARLEVVLVAAALLIVAFSLLLPEFRITTHSGASGIPRTTEQWLYFDVLKTKTTYSGNTYTDYESYNALNSIDYESVADELANVKTLLACWALLCWMLIVVLVYGRELVQVIVGWMTVIAGLVAIVYPVLEISVPVQGMSGFYGSGTLSNGTVSWGPSSAWYLGVIAVILVGAAVVRRMSWFFMEPPKKDEESEVLPAPNDGIEKLTR
jgi:hypothetical protein